MQHIGILSSKGWFHMGVEEGNGVSAAPFFIVYKARSGSTFLADLLVRHPQIGIAPESNFVPLMLKWARQDYRRVITPVGIQELLDVLYAESKFASWDLNRDSLQTYLTSIVPLEVSGVLAEILRFYCATKYPGSSIFGMKKGGWYTENTELVRKILPESKFIHIIRDGRAVFSSAKRAIHSYKGVSFEVEAAASALRWKRMVKAFDRMRSERNALEIQYEAMITEPRETVSRILKFLDARHDSATIEELLVPQRATFVDERNAHLHPNVGFDPKRSRIDAWKQELNVKEIEAFERVAGRTLSRKGYIVQNTPTSSDRVYEMRVRAMGFMKELGQSMKSKWGSIGTGPEH
jgi:hypothetical protein